MKRTSELLRNLRKYRRCLPHLKALFACSLVVWSTFTLAAETTVIVNSSVSQQVLTQTELRQIFTGHRQFWDNGTKIHVFVLDDHAPLHKSFCRETLKMFPYQLSRLWDQLTYSGQGVTPTRVPSTEALIKLLEDTPGAIGYMKEGRATDARMIKVVTQ
ncbi:hypothetical protein GTH32_04825 [Alteromonas sp. 345S023]|uniref:PBP domain-containing protein n=1 Tax=Alteromonas profundi TaxID=2696062 RepID=A0A7X5LJH8_9ALTE|nr:hypothetical protein [Alteromonas profundi]NDV90521.1 hypothetical protein [Alteromonas profundi]